MRKKEGIAEDIKSILKEDTRGLTIQEIANLTKVSRITANIALAKLEGSGIIVTRKIGNCKLHYLAHSIGHRSWIVRAHSIGRRNLKGGKNE